MSNSKVVYQLTSAQSFFFVVLRIAIGWHFLREGYVKLVQPSWNAYGYLMASWGPFAPVFHTMAETDWMLQIANVSMPWMLTLAGIGLMFGVFTRLSTLLAMVLLLMFYFSTPPWPIQLVSEPVTAWGPFLSSINQATWAGQQMLGAEGNYMIVNKNLIEFFALAALLTTNSGQICGLDALIAQYFGRKPADGGETAPQGDMQPAQ